MKVLIDSKYRQSGTCESYVFKLAEPVKKINNISLEQFSFCNSIYNIDTGYNVFTLTSDPSGTPTNYTITLTRSNYTASSLATEVKAELVAASAGGTWDCVYTAASNNFTISNNTIDWQITCPNKTIADILGIDQLTLTTGVISAGNNFNSYMIDVAYPPYVYCSISTGSSNVQSLIDYQNYHTFYIDLCQTPSLAFSDMAKNSYYQQIESNNNQDIQYLNIYFHYDDLTITPNFNDVNHQILLNLT